MYTALGEPGTLEMRVKARKTRETATAVHAAYYGLTWVTRFSSRSYLEFVFMLLSRSTIFCVTIYICDYGTVLRETHASIYNLTYIDIWLRYVL
jgi:hypothetical protein